MKAFQLSVDTGPLKNAWRKKLWKPFSCLSPTHFVCCRVRVAPKRYWTAVFFLGGTQLLNSQSVTVNNPAYRSFNAGAVLLIRRDLMGIRKPETGRFRIFFSGHWSRNGVATCHFFHTVSGFRTAATLWSSGIRILVPNWSNKMKPNISTTIEQKEFLKVLTVKLIQLDSCWAAEPLCTQLTVNKKFKKFKIWALIFFWKSSNTEKL
jgi:hypothetical protein